MSNKIQLQTNNTKLDSLTSLVSFMRDKVADLPDAGSGGSGNGVCAVEIVANVPAPNTTIHYLDENVNIVSRQLKGADLMGGIRLTCKINSFIYSSNSAFTDTSNVNTGNVLSTGEPHLLLVKGDGTFIIN